MKKILEELIESKSLSKQSAKEVLIDISKEKYNTSQIAAFLTTYMMRSIKVEELSGFREALLELCISVDLEGRTSTDMCGTGGDGKNTFNLSTISSFVVAGAGINVTKHGNYGVSSSCGSSNVMEFLGYNFTNDKAVLLNELDSFGITFFHAPLFHPAMKAVGPVRRELGMKTFFNMLGPLVNPGRPTHQVTGVYNLELMRLYDYLLRETNTTYSVVYGLDGYDEVSLTGDFKVVTKEKQEIINPLDLGFAIQEASSIHGGNSIEESAKIFTNVLDGSATVEQKNAVVANSALAISLVNEISLSDAILVARESLDSKKALNTFKSLINSSRK